MLELFRDSVHLIRRVSALVWSFSGQLIRWRLGRRFAVREFGAHLRTFFDRSGLIYRKLGQYLAMRSDLLPPEICFELDMLFEDVSPMPFTQVELILARELGRPWREFFASFDPQALGSASVAQVHRAVSLDGEVLAVKVQRAGIQEQFASDVRVFRRIARACDWLRLAGSLSLRRLFDEFASFTAAELDFVLEGRTADRLRGSMSPNGYVPLVKWDLTTERLLTMEFVEGPSFLYLCRLHETGRDQELARILNGLDLDRIVSDLADECFHQLFVTGFFHGDPHPGNVILRNDGTYVFLDCGISGDLSSQQRRDLCGFVENLGRARFAESAYYYTRLCELSNATDISGWMHDVSSALSAWHSSLINPNSPIEERHMGQLQGQIAAAMRRHHVQNGPNQLLVWRALVLLDTTTLRLPVHFDLLQKMIAFFRRLRGDIRGILGSAVDAWLIEAPGRPGSLSSPLRRALGGRASAAPLTILSQNTKRRGGNKSASRWLSACAGLVCGAVSYTAGNVTVGLLAVLAGAILLLFASRR